MSVVAGQLRNRSKQASSVGARVHRKFLKAKRTNQSDCENSYQIKQPKYWRGAFALTLGCAYRVWNSNIHLNQDHLVKFQPTFSAFIAFVLKLKTEEMVLYWRLVDHVVLGTSYQALYVVSRLKYNKEASATPL